LPSDFFDTEGPLAPAAAAAAALLREEQEAEAAAAMAGAAGGGGKIVVEEEIVEIVDDPREAEEAEAEEEEEAAAAAGASSLDEAVARFEQDVDADDVRGAAAVRQSVLASDAAEARHEAADMQSRLAALRQRAEELKRKLAARKPVAVSTDSLPTPQPSAADDAALSDWRAKSLAP
jgi:predicted ATPase